MTVRWTVVVLALLATGMISACTLGDGPELTSEEVIAIVKNRLSDKTPSEVEQVWNTESRELEDRTVTRTCLEETLAVSGVSRWESDYVRKGTWAAKYVTLTGQVMSETSFWSCWVLTMRGPMG